MSWEYAELSHRAKLAGGPEKYIEAIKEASQIEGARVGALATLAVVGVAGLLIAAYSKKKSVQAAEAEKDLLCGINRYDSQAGDFEGIGAREEEDLKNEQD